MAEAAAAFAVTPGAVGIGDDNVLRGDGLGGATIGRLCDDGCMLPFGRCLGATLVPDSNVPNCIGLVEDPAVGFSVIDARFISFSNGGTGRVSNNGGGNFCLLGPGKKNGRKLKILWTCKRSK